MAPIAKIRRAPPVAISMRVPADLLAAIDAAAESARQSRTAYMLGAAEQRIDGSSRIDGLPADMLRRALDRYFAARHADDSRGALDAAAYLAGLLGFFLDGATGSDAEQPGPEREIRPAGPEAER